VLRVGGDAAGVVRDVVAECGADRVYAGRRRDPAGRAQETRAAAALRETGVELVLMADNLLHDPETVRSRSGSPYRVFTPFWRTVQPSVYAEEYGGGVSLVAGGRQRRPPAPPVWPRSVDLEELHLLPRSDWAAGLRAAWAPGEAGAQAALSRFLSDGLANYATHRDLPSEVGTSRLSPHLHFGEISVRRVWQEVGARCSAAGSHGGKGPAEAGLLQGAEVFRTELGWRDFAHHVLWHFPHTPRRPLRPEFDSFPWEVDAEGLEAWRRGSTGYPIVDAGMRQLWQTGWMHNRVRMIVASFLVKDLLVNWQEGARWFWDTLVDGDLAANTLGWQWAAGCGADAAPYFRIFNPVLQGRTHDPDGAYVREFVPELSKIPRRWIHDPWEAPEDVLREAGVSLGHDYPRPMVDHAVARRTALAALGQVTQRSAGG